MGESRAYEYGKYTSNSNNKLLDNGRFSTLVWSGWCTVGQRDNFQTKFELLFLQQPQKYYCRLTVNVDGNPLAPPAGEEDEEAHNPPARMAQANPYMFAMYG